MVPAMIPLITRCTRLLSRRDRGATAAEYALLASLIAAVVAVVVGTLGQAVIPLFESAASGF